jgi:hypothetical protein
MPVPLALDGYGIAIVALAGVVLGLLVIVLGLISVDRDLIGRKRQ